VVQVPRRCPVRSGAGTPQVPCQEWCRYPAGAQDSCQEWCRNWPTASLTQRFPGCVIMRLIACSMEKETLWEGRPPLFKFGIRNRRGCCQKQSFCPNWESNQGPLVQGPVHYPPSYHFTLIRFVTYTPLFQRHRFQKKPFALVAKVQGYSEPSANFSTLNVNRAVWEATQIRSS